MFKLLHFSDSHLGFLQYGMVERLKDFAKVLDQIADIAIQNGVDLVVDAGDTFNSPEPDPYSIHQYRLFADKLSTNGIKLISVCGNHNLHSISSKTSGVTWMQAVSGASWDIVYSADALSPEPYSAVNRDRSDHISIVACNWAPSERIAQFLSRLSTATPADVLVLHQSCEGLIPQIGTTEVQLAQFKGVADYVAIGDIHVDKIQTVVSETGFVTHVSSSGSTELASVSEPTQKCVKIVTFEKGVLQGIQSCPLTTRKFLKFSTLNSEAEITNLKNEVFACSALEDSMPVIYFTYNRDLLYQVQKLRAELVERGYRLFKAEPETVINFTETYKLAQEKQSADMDDILVEMLRPHLLDDIAIDLWKNSNNAEEILDGLLNKIKHEATQVMPGPGA